MAKKPETTSVELQPIKTRRIIANLRGTSPLIMHRFAFKAWGAVRSGLVRQGRRGMVRSDRTW